MLGDFVSNVVGIGVFLVIAIIVTVIGIIIYWQYKQASRYKQFKCIVLGKDAFGNAMMEQDNAGIFLDNTTSLKRFFLKKHNTTLDPDKVRYVTFGKYKYVFLRKYSNKNFAFIDLNNLMNEKDPVLTATDQDVNWAIHEYRKHKALDSKNWLKEYLPMLIFIFTIIAILILMTWLFKKFDVISTAAQALNAAAASIADSAKDIAAAQSGTKVLQ